MKYILSCLLIFMSFSVQSDTFRIATGEFVPYCSNAIKNKGFASDVVSKAFTSQGHQVEFHFFPWKRAFELTKAGDYDASSWWSYSEERAADFLYSDKLLENTVHFFYLKNKHPNFEWKTVDDLAGYHIGLTRGYMSPEKLEAAKKDGKIEFVYVNDDEQNFTLLLRERIDIIPINIVSGLELLRTKFAPDAIHQVAFHPLAITTRPGFLLFPKVNKRSEEILRIFNAGMKSIRADGTYGKMLDNLLSGYYSQ